MDHAMKTPSKQRGTAEHREGRWTRDPNEAEQLGGGEGHGGLPDYSVPSSHMPDWITGNTGKITAFLLVTVIFAVTLFLTRP